MRRLLIFVAVFVPVSLILVLGSGQPLAFPTFVTNEEDGEDPSFEDVLPADPRPRIEGFRHRHVDAAGFLVWEVAARAAEVMHADAYLLTEVEAVFHRYERNPEGGTRRAEPLRLTSERGDLRLREAGRVAEVTLTGQVLAVSGDRRLETDRLDARLGPSGERSVRTDRPVFLTGAEPYVRLRAEGGLSTGPGPEEIVLLGPVSGEMDGAMLGDFLTGGSAEDGVRHGDPGAADVGDRAAVRCRGRVRSARQADGTTIFALTEEVRVERLSDGSWLETPSLELRVAPGEEAGSGRPASSVREAKADGGVEIEQAGRHHLRANQAIWDGAQGRLDLFGRPVTLVDLESGERGEASRVTWDEPAGRVRLDGRFRLQFRRQIQEGGEGGPPRAWRLDGREATIYLAGGPGGRGRGGIVKATAEGDPVRVQAEDGQESAEGRQVAWDAVHGVLTVSGTDVVPARLVREGSTLRCREIVLDEGKGLVRLEGGVSGTVYAAGVAQGLPGRSEGAGPWDVAAAMAEIALAREEKGSARIEALRLFGGNGRAARLGSGTREVAGALVMWLADGDVATAEGGPEGYAHLRDGSDRLRAKRIEYARGEGRVRAEGGVLGRMRSVSGLPPDAGAGLPPGPWDLRAERILVRLEEGGDGFRILGAVAEGGVRVQGKDVLVEGERVVHDARAERFEAQGQARLVRGEQAVAAPWLIFDRRTGIAETRGGRARAWFKPDAEPGASPEEQALRQVWEIGSDRLKAVFRETGEGPGLERAEAGGRVVLSNEDAGVGIHGEQLNWDAAARKVTLEGSEGHWVVVTRRTTGDGPEDRVEAPKARVDLAEGRVHLVGGVHGTLHAPDPEAGEIRTWAVKAGWAEVSLDPAGRTLRGALLGGGVEAVSAATAATGQSAIWEARRERILLEGDPARAIFRGNRAEGPYVEVDLARRAFRVQGTSSAVFQPGAWDRRTP